MANLEDEVLHKAKCKPLVMFRFINDIIKSPRFTGGDFVFVPVRTLPDSCSRNNFWTTFWISFIFGTIVGPDL